MLNKIKEYYYEFITPYIEQAQALIDKVKCTVGLA